MAVKPAMEEDMSEHAQYISMMALKGPLNTLPMMTGEGPLGPLEMGGMFTVVKVRGGLVAGDYGDPGWYRNPEGTHAKRVSRDLGAGRVSAQASVTVCGTVRRANQGSRASSSRRQGP
jgi:hypothetical protein